MSPLLDNPFLEAALSMPTVVFSVLMVPVAFYWLLSLLGLFHLDFLDHADGAVDHALEGAVDHAFEGAVDHALEGTVDHALDHALDGAVDHAADHALEGVGGHALESGGLGDPDHLLGSLGHVPKTLSLSLLVFFGWTLSLLGSLYVPGFQTLATRGLWVGAILALGVSILALVATALALKPLVTALHSTLGPTRRELVGRYCRVKTLRVDGGFGQAEVDDGQLVQVRTRGDAVLAAGTNALIYDYDPQREVFFISAADTELETPAPGPERSG
ncbi:MAG: hypothetical protein MI919_09395 [Holophagales bacterium]|nr:hypothetical protein [Holophagales bacterium]